MSEAGERSEPRPEGRVAERLSAADGEAQQVVGEARRPRGERSHNLTLLSRAYCHLCDEMLAAIQPLAAAAGATIAIVDVDANPKLERDYGDRVPVLFAGEPGSGDELCHFRLDLRRVEAALRHRTGERS